MQSLHNFCDEEPTRMVNMSAEVRRWDPALSCVIAVFIQ